MRQITCLNTVGTVASSAGAAALHSMPQSCALTHNDACHEKKGKTEKSMPLSVITGASVEAALVCMPADETQLCAYHACACKRHASMVADERVGTSCIGV